MSEHPPLDKDVCEKSDASVRIEEDLLGERELSNELWYGIHTLRAVENFQISREKVCDHPDFVRAMALVKRACAQANRDLGALEPQVAQGIISACDALLDGEHLDQFPVDMFQGGAGTSVNMNVNEVIANIALVKMGWPKGDYDVVHPNDDVNCSQSTNDTYPTGLRLAAIWGIDKVVGAIEKLAQAFAAKAEEFSDVLKMGRTQLQDAVPMTLGQEFAAYSTMMHEEVRHLKREAELLLEVNLGATAIGTGLNTPPGYAEKAVSYLALDSHLPLICADNLVEATSDVGAFIAIHAGLKRLAAKLGKVCNDLRLLSSGPRSGLGEINLPQRQAGSSIMPAKVNPVIPEVVNQVCFKIIGNDITVTMAAEAGQLELNVMEPVIAQATFESVELLTHAIDTLREKCVEGITANRKVCADNVYRSIGIVTYLNPIIGHDAGDEVGAECAASGRSVREVVVEMGLMSEEQLDEVLTAENLIRPRYLGRTFQAAGPATMASTRESPRGTPGVGEHLAVKKEAKASELAGESAPTPNESH